MLSLQQLKQVKNFESKSGFETRVDLRPMIHGVAVRAVTCRARRPGFNLSFL